MLAHIKRILGYGDKYSKTFFFLLAAAMIMLAQRIFSFFAFKAIGDGAMLANANAFVAIMIGVIVAELLKGIAAYLSDIMQLRLQVGATHSIRSGAMRRILFAKWYEFNEFDAGDIVVRIERDAPQWTGFIGNICNSILTLPGLFIVLAIAFSYNWQLCALAFSLCIITNYILSARMTRIITSATDAIQEALSHNQNKLIECIKAAGSNRWFNRNSETLDEFCEANDAVFRAALRKEKQACIRQAVNLGFQYASDLIYLCVGGYMCYRNAVSLGAFLAIFSVRNAFFSPFQILLDLRASYRESASFEKRVTELLEIPEEDLESGESTPIRHALPIVFDNVSFSYSKDKPVTDGLSFVAKPYGVTALRGPSGCGKSTALKLLMRFADPACGSINIGGRPLRELSLRALRGGIVYLSQDAYLFNDTVENNIRLFAPGASREAVMGAARLVNIHDFILSLSDGYNTRLINNANSLSQGQRQRVAIARALLSDAPIVLMDEITSNLDARASNDIAAALDGWLAGKTCVVISHGSFLCNKIDAEVNIG